MDVVVLVGWILAGLFSISLLMVKNLINRADRREKTLDEAISRLDTDLRNSINSHSDTLHGRITEHSRRVNLQGERIASLEAYRLAQQEQLNRMEGLLTEVRTLLQAR